MAQLNSFRPAGQLHGSNTCFGCGPANLTGLKLEFFLAEDDSVISHPIVGNGFEGPHGYLHGGIIATLLDETMSKSVRARGLIAMTRHLEVDYLRPVPSGSQLRLEGRLVRSEGRKHWSEARILNDKGVELAQGKGLFIEVRNRTAPAIGPTQAAETAPATPAS